MSTSARSADVIFKHPFTGMIEDLRDRAIGDFACAFYRTSALYIPKSYSREEFYGVSVNGPLFSPESWTR